MRRANGDKHVEVVTGRATSLCPFLGSTQCFNCDVFCKVSHEQGHAAPLGEGSLCKGKED
jgi:hypothetical protein